MLQFEGLGGGGDIPKLTVDQIILDLIDNISFCPHLNDIKLTVSQEL